MPVVQAEAEAAKGSASRECQKLTGQCSTLTEAKVELQASLEQETARANQVHAALARKAAELTDTVRNMSEQHQTELRDALAQRQRQIAEALQASSARLAALQVRLPRALCMAGRAHQQPSRMLPKRHCQCPRAHRRFFAPRSEALLYTHKSAMAAVQLRLCSRYYSVS